ncbi:MAG: PAS domain-containing protein [Bdellovibrionaceae bacterium]|nr:PAS domain-containing protein [Pseudobdellovibrionaceae bacterium]
MLPVYALLSIITLTMCASFALMAYSWQNRGAPGSPAFCATMALTFIWSTFTLFVLVTPDEALMETLIRLRMAVILFAPPAIVLIHTHVNPRADLYGRPYLQALLFVPCVVAVASLFVPSWSEYGLVDFEKVQLKTLSALTFTRGPIMSFQRIYSILCVTYGLSLGGRMWWRGDASTRRQALWLMAGSLVPIASHWAGMVTGWTITMYQWSAALGLVGALCFSMALFRYQLLDWAHLAKSQVFERLPDPVLKLDNENRLRVFNTAAQRVFAISQGHVGQEWKTISTLPGPVIDRVSEEILAMRQGVEPRRTLEVIHEAGSWAVHIECARTWNPQDTGLLLSFYDLSERKALESQIRERSVELTDANSRLEELVGFKNRLLSLVAHDLSGNIGTMVMVSSALQSKIENEVDEPARKMLRLMVRSSVSVQEFFSNLIQWIAKLDSRMEPRLGICDLQALVEKSVEQLTPILLVQRQTVVVTAPKVVLIAADPDMITAVIRNLISNAIGASQAGQEIAVGIDDGPSEVTLWVKDTGVGIAPSRLAQLIDGGALIDRDAEAPAPGFGIGLNVCRDFIHFHGGRLAAESTPGSGSRFYFTLPKGSKPSV